MQSSVLRRFLPRLIRLQSRFVRRRANDVTGNAETAGNSREPAQWLQVANELLKFLRPHVNQQDGFY